MLPFMLHLCCVQPNAGLGAEGALGRLGLRRTSQNPAGRRTLASRWMGLGPADSPWPAAGSSVRLPGSALPPGRPGAPAAPLLIPHLPAPEPRQ